MLLPTNGEQLFDWVGIGLGLFALVCVFLPCKWDPAIRIKEWLDSMDKEGGDDHDPF
jgi:hypothetical protein